MILMLNFQMMWQMYSANVLLNLMWQMYSANVLLNFQMMWQMYSANVLLNFQDVANVQCKCTAGHFVLMHCRCTAPIHRHLTCSVQIYGLLHKFCANVLQAAPHAIGELVKGS
jgi:hypothetical protein